MNREGEDEMQRMCCIPIDLLTDVRGHRSEAFVEEKDLSLPPFCIIFTDKFHNTMALYSLKSSYNRTPGTLKKERTSLFSVAKSNSPETGDMKL